ncbi:MAG: trypsin-like serine protease, partial [Tannerella sp.]|nr:trypsin-like serine protease [Tannerella sp.]
VKDLQEVDHWRAREGTPMPVAKLIAVDYTMENSGSRTTFPGGEHVWRLHLRTADAVAVMLYYQDFYIPEGGKLFIYNADKTQLLGAYTHNTHPSGGLFATEFVGGDELILEYVASETSEEKPRIHISDIGYGYNVSALETFTGVSLRKASGSCMVNINCEEGLAWQNEKKSVCYMVQRIGRSSYMCTGSLMNNTAEDFKPLILTALHCAYDEDLFVDEKDLEQWSFYFHREREDCSETSLSAVSKTMTGCKILVKTGLENGSDGMLLELNQMIPESYDVFFNGWDRRHMPAFSGVCIHHPQGDYKKISTYSTPAKEATFNATEFTGTRSAHWNVTFQQTANGHGVTEGGSSGSPLYNENKLVVGTLSGGSSSCLLPAGLNLYGKISYHWNHYKADSTHMDIWLDPVGSGVETLAGRFHQKVSKPVPVNLTAENQGHSILLRWNAPQSTETPLCYNIYRHNQKIGQATGSSFVDPAPVNGTLIYSVSAIYADEQESPFVSTTLLYVEFKAPSDLRAERMDTSNEVTLSWRAPVYEQTIYWGTMEPEWIVGFENSISFYYGQKWSSEEINPLHEKTIKAVRFAPMKNNTYEIYVSQGDCVYRQPVDSSSLDYSEINTVMLNEPFTIDGSKSLIVAIYISYVGSEYPAVSDNGPAVNGKGNVCSVDGENWETLYDENDPDDFNYNFIISAIVSSESGTIGDACGNNKNRLRRDAGEMIKTKNAGPRKVKRAIRNTSVSPSSVSPYNSVPSAFPEVTKYRIYRSNSVYQHVYTPSTHYIDRGTTSPSFYYTISAFYGDNIESEKSDKAYITIVNNGENIDEIADIYPTRFSGSVNLKGFDAVTRVDVVSVSGKICLVVNHPDRTINTSSLAPGLYFFRIYGPNNQVLKVVRAVKMSG